MIKITVNPQHEPKSFAFDQPFIVIGEGSPETVDICFPSEGLHQNHLRIVLKEDGYWVINQANDPFTTYNGQSFGKKKLQAGDLIQIRDHVMRIDELTQAASLKPVLISSASVQAPESDPGAFDAYPDVDSLANDENPEAWFPSDITSLHPSEKEKDSKQTPHHQPAATADFSAKLKKKALKLSIAALVFITALIGIAVFEVYFRAHTQSGRDEMLAAESLADYAMALTYAKVYHIAPQKQNWVDPSFIKNNLADLLSSTSNVCCNIDAQGQFCNCPYLLRFYTNRDFSRFLLLAQPEATLSQWLIPKDTLLLDSTTMEIRKTHDLRSLNRLLSIQNPLDGGNGEEILAEISKTQIVPLSDLAHSIGKKEFAPPKALSYLKPGAENRIYNAPRYHPFSATFLKKAMTFSNQPLTNHEQSLLQSELNILSKFPDIVFFSSGGMQEAITGHRALKKLVLPHSFFTAYLIFSDRGDILNSRIVLDSDLHSPVSEIFDAIALSDTPPTSAQFSSPFRDEELLGKNLGKAADKAKKMLHPLLLNLHILLNDIIEKESLTLPQSFFELVALYQKKQGKIRKEVAQTLEAFQAKHPNADPLLVNKVLREYGLLDIYLSPDNKEEMASPDIKKDERQWEAYQELKEVVENSSFQPPYRSLKGVRGEFLGKKRKAPF
jgi:hypothetical protein